MLKEDIEELIKQITSPKKEDNSRTHESFEKFLEQLFDDSNENEVIVHGPENVNTPLYRNGAGYKAEFTDGKIKKGDVLAVAQVAGIMAAKKTWEIIPMCHPLLLTGVDIHFELHPEVSEIEAIASVRTTGKTGIEMEALHAVSAALLTVYDMCKAVDRGMVIKDILLLEKDGGKSGHYVRS